MTTQASTVQRRARGWDLPTVVLFVACVCAWGGALALYSVSAGVSVVAMVLVLVLHSSLTHEILHGSPFGSERLGTALGAVQFGIAVPYMRFKRLHLAHHMDAKLTDPYDDPESNYLDPAKWAKQAPWKQALRRFNNTLGGRMIVGPVLGQWAFMRSDWQAIRAGDRDVLGDWVLHVPGVVVTLGIVALSQMPVAVYLVACYGALMILKIRTFLEHRAHEKCAARTVVVEDRGLLAFLFLNNNFHVVHHMHPQVSWYALPALYRARRGQYLARNQDYVYRSYGAIFAAFLWRSKDPVAHPLWREGAE